MTLAAIRRILRRRIQEDIPDNWTDTELNELINEAYVWVQLQFAQTNPEALVHIDYTTLEIDKSFYPFPRGFVAVKEMAYLDTSDPLGYRDLGEPRDFWINRRQPTTGDDVSWSYLGRHFAIMPKPPATVQAAIRLIWTGTLTLANENDVPEIPFNHMSIVVKAQIMTYGETADDSRQLTAELQDYLSGIAAIPPSGHIGNDALVITGLGRTTLR